MLYPSLSEVWYAVSQTVLSVASCIPTCLTVTSVRRQESEDFHQQERKFSISTPGFQLIQQPFYLNVCLPAEVCLIQRYRDTGDPVPQDDQTPSTSVSICLIFIDQTLLCYDRLSMVVIWHLALASLASILWAALSDDLTLLSNWGWFQGFSLFARTTISSSNQQCII